MPPYRVLQDEWSDYDDDSDVEVHEGKDESRDGLSPPDSSTPARHSLQKSPRGRSPQEVAIKEEWVELSDTDGEIETEPVQQETIEVLHDDTRAVYRNVVSQSKGKSLSQPLEQVMSISTQNTVSQRPQAVFSPALRGVSARSSHDTVSRQITKSYEEHAQVYRTVHHGTAYLVMELHGLPIMRRESDGWLNATQIAKLAGLLQGSKIRIAQDQIVGAFRTVKGGYAKIQGTWVEYKYGRQFAGAHGLDQILLPLLEYDGTTAQRLHSQPGKLPGEQILIEERARGLENMTGDQVLEPQTENTPTGSPVANIPVHEKQPSEQALNALASREDWLDSSGSEDELSPFFDSGDGDMPRPRVVSDVSHASQPPVNMNSKRKRQSEPQGHDSDDAVRAQKRMKQSLFPLASEDKVQPEPFHDYNQTSAQLLSRTIRNALLDPGTTAPSSIHGYYGHGSVNASIGIGVGRQKTGGEYSTQVGSITSRIRRERLGELGRWFDRRELADNNAVFRNVDKVRAGVPWDQMRSEEQAKVRTRVRRKILHQRYQEGRSESYFISQLLKLANESGVSNDAILGLLLQQRKSRETLVELFEGLVKVNESGTLSVNQAMSGDAEEEWETE